jgi:hypothetical protein
MKAFDVWFKAPTQNDCLLRRQRLALPQTPVKPWVVNPLIAREEYVVAAMRMMCMSLRIVLHRGARMPPCRGRTGESTEG